MYTLIQTSDNYGRRLVVLEHSDVEEMRELVGFGVLEDVRGRRPLCRIVEPAQAHEIEH